MPIAPLELQVQLEKLFKESRRLLEIAKRGVEIAIEQDERAAIEWMQESARV